MALDARSFFIRKDSGGLQEARSFISSALGLEGDRLIRMEAVRFHDTDELVQLRIFYLTEDQSAYFATSPSVGAILPYGIHPHHASILFSNKIDSSSIVSGSFTFQGTGLDSSRVFLETNEFVTRIDLRGLGAGESGFHYVDVDATKLKYRDGKFVQNSFVIGHTIGHLAAPHQGESIPYTVYRGRRGEINIASVIIHKGSLPDDILKAFVSQSGVNEDRIITSTTVSLNDGFVQVFFAYFVTLEPQVVSFFPNIYSLAVNDFAPPELTIVFKESLDANYVSNTHGLFQLATAYNLTSGIHSGDVSVQPDRKTVKISTSRIFTGKALYDFRVGAVRSEAGIEKTRYDIYPILVSPYHASGDAVSASTVNPGSGLEKIGNDFNVRLHSGLFIDTASNTIQIKPANATITTSPGGASVGIISGQQVLTGTLSGSHLINNNVPINKLDFGMVETITIDGLTFLSGDVELIGGTNVTLVTAGQAVTINAPAAGGVTGAKTGIARQIDNTVGTDIFVIKPANSSIVADDLGLAVGKIGTVHLSGNIIHGGHIIDSQISGSHIANSTIPKADLTFGMVETIVADGGSVSGDVTFANGTNLTINRAGQTLTFNASSAGGVTGAKTGIALQRDNTVPTDIFVIKPANSTIVADDLGVAVGKIGNIHLSGNMIGTINLSGINIISGHHIGHRQISGTHLANSSVSGAAIANQTIPNTALVQGNVHAITGAGVALSGAMTFSDGTGIQITRTAQTFTWNINGPTGAFSGITRQVHQGLGIPIFVAKPANATINADDLGLSVGKIGNIHLSGNMIGNVNLSGTAIVSGHQIGNSQITGSTHIANASIATGKLTTTVVAAITSGAFYRYEDVIDFAAGDNMNLVFDGLGKITFHSAAGGSGPETGVNKIVLNDPGSLPDPIIGKLIGTDPVLKVGAGIVFSFDSPTNTLTISTVAANEPFTQSSYIETFLFG